MKLHKLIQRASAAVVASAMILSVTLPTLAAAPDGTGNAAAADMVNLTNGTAALSEEDEGQDTGITVNGQSVLVNSTEVDNIPIQYTGGTDVSTLTILQAVAGNLAINIPTAAGGVDVVMKTESGAAVGGKLTVAGAHNVTITGETMAADRADIDDISGDLTLIATGEGGKAIRDWISVCVSSSSGEKAIYVGSNRETEQFKSRIHPCVWHGWHPSEAYISVRKAPACPVTVHGGELDNSEDNTTFYKGETVWVKTSRPEKGLKFNCWLFPADVETTDDPTDTAFFFTMPDHAVEVTASWELYTGSEPTVFWEYYTYSGLLTPDNTPQDPAGMSYMTVSYDSASKTYTVDLKGDLEIPVDFKGNENPNIKVKGELGNSVHISGANNVSVDIDFQNQNEETNLNVDCAGTLRLKNNTGNSPLELRLTYKRAEGAGYTVVLDGDELEKTPAYENAAVSLNESLTIIPDISDPIPDDSSASGDSSDAAGALVAAAVAGAAVFGGYTIITELMLQDLLPEGAAIPKNQAQLAKLVWQTAGFPEPENASAFANVTDPETAKAAQWCVEQGYLDADFDPDRWTPKFKVIQTWNKAFPKQ